MFTIFSTKRKSLLAVTCALALALGAVGGGLAVSANAEGETAEVTPIIPLAKYEFLDAENPGKDSMGNYDLSLRVADKKETGKVTVKDGVASFDGSAGLIATNDISEDVTSFTLYFELQQTALPGNWASPIGFGWNDWKPTKWATFQFSRNSDLLRFSSASALINDGSGNVSNVDGHGDAFWGHEIGNVGSEYHKVALTVDLDGKIIVYLDGNASANYAFETPEGFNLKDSNMRFAMGGESCWGNLYNAFTGNLKNVCFYDFALNAEQIKTLGADYSLDTGDLGTTAYLESVDSSTLTFENDKVTVETLYEEMSQEQMLACMGNATVKGTLSDKSEKKLPVIWTSVKETDDGWKAHGHVQNAGLGLPSLVERTEIVQNVEVKTAQSVTVASDIKNGTVTLSPDYGVTGDIITITPIPAEHYEIDTVTVDGEAIEPTDGKYTFTIGNKDVTVSATFKQKVYKVCVGEGVEHGTITFSANEGVIDTEIEVTATPDEHYVLSKLFVNDKELTRSEGKYTFKITGDMTVTAEFNEAVYSIDCFVDGGNGTAEADKASAKAGETVTIDVTPAEGYTVDAVMVNGTALEAKDGVYSFVVDDDSEIEVTFKSTAPSPDSSSSGSAQDSTEPDSSSTSVSKPDSSSGADNGGTGCGSMIGISAGIAFLSIGAAILIKKRKHD